MESLSEREKDDEHPSVSVNGRVNISVTRIRGRLTRLRMIRRSTWRRKQEKQL